MIRFRKAQAQARGKARRFVDANRGAIKSVARQLDRHGQT